MTFTPVPKPPRREKRPRKPLPPSSSRPPRKRKRTAAQEAAKFAREFGSVERVEYIKTRRCVVGMLCQGPMQNMHTKGDGGSRKGHHTTIVAACERHHDQAHRNGQVSLGVKWGIDWTAEAAQCERDWVAFSGGAENEEETA